MSKRFTDTDKWKKPWFRNLTPIQKCFWAYLTDNCNQAGIWEVDFNLAEIFIGAKLDVEDLRQVFNKQYEEVCSGKRWFLKDFPYFQYGELRDTNRLHIFVMNILEKEGVSTPLGGPVDRAKDKDKDKDIGGSVRGGRFSPPSLPELQACFTEKGISKAEAAKFMAYYDSVGWVVGRTRKPMKNWRGAVATWIGNLGKWENDGSFEKSSLQKLREIREKRVSENS